MINEEHWGDYNRTTQGEEGEWAILSWKHKQKAGEGDERGVEGCNLCRTVQNAADELDQLLYALNRLAGQEVLLVGCVEDDNGRNSHFPEKKTNIKNLKKGI